MDLGHLTDFQPFYQCSFIIPLGRYAVTANQTQERIYKWADMKDVDDFADKVKGYRAGTYAPEAFVKYRLHNGGYTTRMTSDYSMVRVKVPAGRISPEQLRRFSLLSEQYSIGSAHITARENMQLHWVVLEDVPDVLRALAEVDMSSRESCGNTVHNVVCSPTAGICSDEAFDPTPYAEAVASFFLRSPMTQNIPRKFKVSFGCCNEHNMARTVDVGFMPQVRTVNSVSRRGFKVYMGGGMGPKSAIGRQLEDFTDEDNLIYTLIAILKVYDRMGDRKNVHRNRLRHLVEQMGWETIRDLVFKERNVVRITQSANVRPDIEDAPAAVRRRPVRILAEGAAEPGYSKWIETSTIVQKQPEYSAVFVTLEAGDISSQQLADLADIIEEYSGESTARLGLNQNVVLRYVHQDDLESLYSRLLRANLARTGALTMAATMGCVGTASCNLALTNAHRMAKEIQREFMRRGLDEDRDLWGSSVKVSGCPNSCGRHVLATVGMYGGGDRNGRDMYPSYTMLVGGRIGADAALGRKLIRVPAKRAIPMILRILEVFRERKLEGDNLESWMRRVCEDADTTSIAELRDLVAPLAVPPSREEDPDFYTDYGADVPYMVMTGRGCTK